jgi:hypothetical protein
MVAKDVATNAGTEVTPMDLGTVQWETRVQESGDQIVFDTIGDVFIGQFTGARKADTDDGQFTILTFMGVDGKPYQTNAGWKLQEGFSDIDSGTIVRVTYVKDVDTGSPSPMKDFRIDVAVKPA